MIVTVLFWFFFLGFVLGAFGIWDRANTREPEGAAPAGQPELSRELELRRLAKQGRQILRRSSWACFVL